ncbi:transmembrane protein, putative (macronuclear) [Tetrahymena thermophila SB210]|uniref:Transmembrane protein, putative n=1 Tax=Tetrahymena thermophila (strain SB210) TaxID=312017 RepID=Q23MJ7_TETTS|nr:transmembrane protein, putative [Tetrahymena thermophila SB210]EAR97769.2 transmembrane protein, putative [Tetrahymena thermophila SB210]|eukprot:XP_001018014.2 transmembrane protein, putative [Tetrahymena thermophila SB210]
MFVTFKLISLMKNIINLNLLTSFVFGIKTPIVIYHFVLISKSFQNYKISNSIYLYFQFIKFYLYLKTQCQYYQSQVFKQKIHFLNNLNVRNLFVYLFLNFLLILFIILLNIYFLLHNNNSIQDNNRYINRKIQQLITIAKNTLTKNSQLQHQNRMFNQQRIEMYKQDQMKVNKSVLNYVKHHRYTQKRTLDKRIIFQRGCNRDFNNLKHQSNFATVFLFEKQLQQIQYRRRITAKITQEVKHVRHCQRINLCMEFNKMKNITKIKERNQKNIIFYEDTTFLLKQK